MSKIVNIISAIAGTSIVSAGGAYLLINQNKTSFREAFKNAIIDFDKESQLVSSKLKKLKELSVLSENSRFKLAYDKEKQNNSGAQELKKACLEIYNSHFDNKESNVFKDFQTYCAKTNKDKIGEDNWASSSANWKTRFTKLKELGRIPLSKELEKIALVESTDGLTLKNWCLNIEGLVFEGEDNLVFKDANSSCGKED